MPIKLPNKSALWPSASRVYSVLPQRIKFKSKKQRSVLDNVKTRRLLIKLVWKGGLNRIPNSSNNLWVKGCILWAETPAFSNSALANSHCWLNLCCLLLSNDLPPTQLSNHDCDSWRQMSTICIQNAMKYWRWFSGYEIQKVRYFQQNIETTGHYSHPDCENTLRNGTRVAQAVAYLPFWLLSWG